MIKETQLAAYFEGIFSSKDLKVFLGTIHGENELIQHQNVLNDLAVERDVSIDELIKICDDFIAGELDQDDLMAISLFLEGSDHFTWDSTKPDGALIAEVLDDWSAPETAYPINRKTVLAVRKCLMEGIYDADFLKSVARGK